MNVAEQAEWTSNAPPSPADDAGSPLIRPTPPMIMIPAWKAGICASGAPLGMTRRMTSIQPRSATACHISLDTTEERASFPAFERSLWLRLLSHW
jgi:hypothetical protein